MITITYVKMENKTETERGSPENFNIFTMQCIYCQRTAILELSLGLGSLLKQAPEVRQCTSCPDMEQWSLVWWENINLPSGHPSPVSALPSAILFCRDSGYKTWQVWWICSRWRHHQTPKAFLATVLTEEGRGTDARNNQTVLRARKINTEGKLSLARTDDQEIKTSDDKMLCPDGIYLWLLKETD